MKRHLPCKLLREGLVRSRYAKFFRRMRIEQSTAPVAAISWAENIPRSPQLTTKTGNANFRRLATAFSISVPDAARSATNVLSNIALAELIITVEINKMIRSGLEWARPNDCRQRLNKVPMISDQQPVSTSLVVIS